MELSKKKLIVTYINPDAFSGKKASDAMQPLAIAALAAHTPFCFDIAFYDDRIEEIDYEHKTDLVVLSVATFTARRAYNIAKIFRDRGIPVIMGGFHPTLLPDEAAVYADCIVTGDAENLWGQVLLDFAGGCLKTRYDSGVCENPDNIRFDRNVFAGKKYSMMIPVQLGRGCRYSCDFCSVHSFYGDKRFARKTEDVLDEISSIKSHFLFFTDDNFLFDRAFILDFLDKMKDHHKHWSCQISIEAATDDELLASLSQAGCMAVFVGFESMKKGNLERMGKASNMKYPDYSLAIKRFAKAGILVSGSFVFGYPGDTQESIDSAFEFGMKNKLTLCHFNPLFPFPMTRVYERLQDEKRLIYQAWWNEELYRYGEPMFRPQDMGAQELTHRCNVARLKFNTFRNIFLRSLSLRNNLRSPFRFFAYLISNLITRKEIRRKLKMRLG